MLGMSELLLKHRDSEDRDSLSEKLGLIHDTAENTLGLLTNLLDWSASQAGQLEFLPKSLDIKRLVQSNIKLAQSQAAAKRISIVYAPSESVSLDADQNMLNTVIRNLISNAVKFTRTDDTIAISTVDRGEHCELTISDNGVGMSAENLSRLFQPNAVQSSTGTAQEQGSGLGLLLCKEFITHHSGEINVKSELDEGSIFTIILPKRIPLSSTVR